MRPGIRTVARLMCGRFVSTTGPEELAAYFSAEPPGADLDLGARYNVAPTQNVLVVVDDGVARRIDRFRWGLVPFWAKDPAIGNRMINARAETIAEKSSFRGPFAKRRCIVAADGFYEWKKSAGSAKKQPMYISTRDGSPFAFAGLWDEWDDHNHRGGSGDPTRLRSCTIVTTTPNTLLARIHDRMPVILNPSAWDDWLDPDNHDVDSLSRLLVAAPARLMQAHPVSTSVNNVRNDQVDLIESVPLDQSGTLAV